MKMGVIVAVDSYHVELFGCTTTVVRKYQKTTVFYTESTEFFFYELEELE